MTYHDPTPKDVLAWAETQPEHAEAAAVLRAAITEARAADKARDAAHSAIADAQRAFSEANSRMQRARRSLWDAFEPLMGPHSIATLPERVAACVADGWIDVTAAAECMPSVYGAGEVAPLRPVGTFAVLVRPPPEGTKPIPTLFVSTGRSGTYTERVMLRRDDWREVAAMRTTGENLFNLDKLNALLSAAKPHEPTP